MLRDDDADDGGDEDDDGMSFSTKLLTLVSLMHVSNVRHQKPQTSVSIDICLSRTFKGNAELGVNNGVVMTIATSKGSNGNRTTTTTTIVTAMPKSF